MDTASPGGHPSLPPEEAEPRHPAAGHSAHDHLAHGHPEPDPQAKVIDPVCGMTVDPNKTPHRHVHQDRTFYFCGNGCRTKFAADPAKYLDEDRKAAAAAAAPAGTIYTCPMHPQIRQVGPGSCPICGMALEPLEPTAETGPNPELADMTRRLWIALALAIPVVVLDMGGDLANLGAVIPPAVSNWIQLVLATPVVLWAGCAVLRARLAVASDPQPQHVHADRHGHRGRLALQRRRHPGARTVSSHLQAWAAPSPSTSKRPP